MTQAIPPGHEGLIAHLIVDDAAGAIEFYKKAFGAEEIMRCPTPDGKKIMHAELTIGGRPIYLADDFPEYCGGQARTPKALGASPFNIHQFVVDCDATIKRAEDAGASVTMAPADMFWGDRYATVDDPYGHRWAFATHISDPTPEEMAAAAAAMFAQ